MDETRNFADTPMPDQQVDLFLDSLVGVPLKDDRALMEFPFFSLQKQPRMEPLVYDDGRTQIRIEPGPKGLATIWDKDILLYVVSLLNERIERGLTVEHTVRFSAHDLLRVTGRGTGKRSYELLLDALYRLRSTNIVTSIESADLRDRRGFGWIETWRVVERKTVTGRKVMAAIEITLNDWMFRALVKERRVLTINPAYFDLEGGLERRVYELARKHLGGQTVWKIGLEKLSRKIGTMRDLRRFKHDLLKVVALDRIPDYRLSVEALADGSRPVVVIEPRPRCSEFSDGAGVRDVPKTVPRRKIARGKQHLATEAPAPPVENCELVRNIADLGSEHRGPSDSEHRGRKLRTSRTRIESKPLISHRRRWL